MAKSTLSPILTCRRVKRFLKNTSLSPDYVMMLVLYLQVWTNYAPDADLARSGPQKLKTSPNFWAHTFWLIKINKKKKKNLDLQVFSRLGITMKELQSISNTSLLVIF